MILHSLSALLLIEQTSSASLNGTLETHRTRYRRFRRMLSPKITILSAFVLSQTHLTSCLEHRRHVVILLWSLFLVVLELDGLHGRNWFGTTWTLHLFFWVYDPFNSTGTLHLQNTITAAQKTGIITVFNVFEITRLFTKAAFIWLKTQYK